MKVALLNTTIATVDGIFEVRTISLEQAQQLAKDNADNLLSAIGHDSTSQIMTELLGVNVTVNRIQFAQELGQIALVFKLKGRAPEGVILDTAGIEAIGYEFKTMTLISGVRS
jgi:hypothetical protein